MLKTRLFKPAELMIERVQRRFFPEQRITNKSLGYLMEKHAAESSMAFIEENLLECESFSTRASLYDYVLPKIPASGLVLEFGVCGGGGGGKLKIRVGKMSLGDRLPNVPPGVRGVSKHP